MYEVLRIATICNSNGLSWSSNHLLLYILRSIVLVGISYTWYTSRTLVMLPLTYSLPVILLLTRPYTSHTTLQGVGMMMQHLGILCSCTVSNTPQTDHYSFLIIRESNPDNGCHPTFASSCDSYPAILLFLELAVYCLPKSRRLAHRLQ